MKGTILYLLCRDAQPDIQKKTVKSSETGKNPPVRGDRIGRYGKGNPFLKVKSHHYSQKTY